MRSKKCPHTSAGKDGYCEKTVLNLSKLDLGR